MYIFIENLKFVQKSSRNSARSKIQRAYYDLNGTDLCFNFMITFVKF